MSTVRIRHEDGKEYELDRGIARHLIHQGRARQIINSDTAPQPQADPNPVDKMTVAELKAHAAEHSIDLGEATKKDEILAAVQAAS